MKIISQTKYNLAYALLPFKRNQDVVQIFPITKKNYQYVACIVDGWNELSLNDDVPGREVAQTVLQIYPEFYFNSKLTNVLQRANDAATRTEITILNKFPVCATSVAMFLFHTIDQDVIVSVGDEEIYLWDGTHWYKPKEIDNHPSVPENPKGSFRFFGCPQKKKDRRYSSIPDVFSFPADTPCIIATDGIKDVLTIDDINSITQTVTKKTSKNLLEALLKEIQRRKTQKDDISILVRW